METKPKKKRVYKSAKEQGLMNPQQILFLQLYTDPKSDTFGNALQSALRAKYSQEYAENITHHMPNWLSRAQQRRERILDKAEDNLQAFIEGNEIAPKIKLEATKFALKGLGKEHYSETAKGEGEKGPKILVNITNYNLESGERHDQELRGKIAEAKEVQSYPIIEQEVEVVESVEIEGDKLIETTEA